VGGGVEEMSFLWAALNVYSYVWKKMGFREGRENVGYVKMIGRDSWQFSQLKKPVIFCVAIILVYK